MPVTLASAPSRKSKTRESREAFLERRVGELESLLAKRNGEHQRVLEAKDAEIAALKAVVASLTSRRQELEARLAENSASSSRPPSSDPPWNKAPTKRREKTGRKRGGQPGHKGTTRSLLPTEQVDHVVTLRPKTCRRCRAPLRQDRIDGDPDPIRHQVTEIPPPEDPIVTEYQAHATSCGCGEVTRAEFPREVSGRAFGPRLQARIALLTGRYRLRDQVRIDTTVRAMGGDGPGAVSSRGRANEYLSLCLAIQYESVYKARMINCELFGGENECAPPPSQVSKPIGAPRLRTAVRNQVEWVSRDLESTLPEDDRARLLWDILGRLDLSRFYESVLARGRAPGAPATDPKILLALWLLATSQGIGNGQEVARLCRLHDAYRWICGGVSVDPHTLTDFRVDHGEALDELFTQVLAVLMKDGALTLDRVAQDGMRTRANAGAASFRREPSLHACLEEARAHLEAVRREATNPDCRLSPQMEAARERGARERLQRVERAIEELPKAQASKRTAEEKSEARVSTTDPEARVMKMGDGGFRPAHNVQFATDTKSRVIVGVASTNSGSDKGQLPPMLQQIEARTGKRPPEYLVDGGFVNLEAIDAAAAQGTVVFAPVPKSKDPSVDPHAPKPGDAPSTIEWRQRMATPAAKEIYKERAATAETVNADARVKRGLGQFPVRGSAKVRTLALLAALTSNLLLEVTIKALGLSG